MDAIRRYFPVSGRLLIALPLSVMALSLGSKSPAHAQEDARELVEKMVAAYGGEHLLGLKTLRLKQEDAIAFPGQGYTPERVEYGIARSDVILDFVNERGSVESWSAHSVYDQHTMTLVDGERQLTINQQTGSFSEEEPNFDVLVLRQIAAASWGPLVARYFAGNADQAGYAGAGSYFGRPQHILEMTFPGNSKREVYLDAATGLISKMEFQTGIGPAMLQFGDYHEVAGVTHARDLNFFIGAHPFKISRSREVVVDPTFPEALFAVSPALVRKTPVDHSQMRVEEVAPGIHHTGQWFAYTSFFDAGDYIIGVGGYAGLTQRFEAFRLETGIDKPLAYQVITHHHTDHMDAATEALELGAKLIITERNKEALRAYAGREIPDDDFVVFEEGMTMGEGPGRITLHEVATSHAVSNLLTIAPASGLMFMADGFYNQWAEGVEPGSVNAVTLARALDELGLEVALFTGSHSAGVRTAEEFRSAVTRAYGDCPSGREICG